MHNKFQVSISTGSKVMTQTLNLIVDLAEWPWQYNVTTQNMRFHEIHMYTKYQMSISIGSIVMVNVKVDEFTCIFYFDLWGWHIPWHITPQNVQLDEIHKHAKYQVYIRNSSKIMGNVKEEWLWPLNVTTQNMRTH